MLVREAQGGGGHWLLAPGSNTPHVGWGHRSADTGGNKETEGPVSAQLFPNLPARHIQGLVVLPDFSNCSSLPLREALLEAPVVSFPPLRACPLGQPHSPTARPATNPSTTPERLRWHPNLLSEEWRRPYKDGLEPRGPKAGARRQGRLAYHSITMRRQRLP